MADGGRTNVEAQDPVVATQMAAAPRLTAVASEARARLGRALASLERAPAGVPA